MHTPTEKLKRQGKPGWLTSCWLTAGEVATDVCAGSVTGDDTGETSKRCPDEGFSLRAPGLFGIFTAGSPLRRFAPVSSSPWASSAASVTV